MSNIHQIPRCEKAMRVHFAYPNDIPGSRCGPEDGPWPRAYQVLDDSDIWRELSTLAKPQSWSFRTATGDTKKIEGLNFQPCPGTRTQDRYVVKQLDIYGKLWTLTCVFDGNVSSPPLVHSHPVS